LLKLFGLFSILLIFTTFLEAKSFENFKKREVHTFTQYTNVNDLEFSSYLKREWLGYSQNKILKFYKETKPNFITPALQTYMKPVGPILNIKIPKDKNTTKKIPYEPINGSLMLNFFGTKLGFNIPAIKNYVFYPKSKDGVSIFFRNIATSQYYDLVDSIKKTSKELNLNDWAKYLLIKKITSKIYGDKDRANLLAWFIFNKLGYDIKIGLHEKHAILMFHLKQKLYQTSSYTITKKKYYVLENYLQGKLGLVYTYKKNYPSAKKVFDFSLKTLPLFTKNIASKTITFYEDSKKYEIPYIYNKNLINFLNTYPQVDTKIYLQTPIPYKSYRKIAFALKRFTREKKASDALNFILHFVQKAFIYETDEKQFKRQKMMFAQQTLYFKKSDSEDRVALFNYLIKHLYGISVVSVKYSDYMMSGLYIPIQGANVKLGRKKFILADPTCIDSNLGQIMTKYKGVKPLEIVKD